MFFSFVLLVPPTYIQTPLDPLTLTEWWVRRISFYNGQILIGKRPRIYDALNLVVPPMGEDYLMGEDSLPP